MVVANANSAMPVLIVDLQPLQAEPTLWQSRLVDMIRGWSLVLISVKTTPALRVSLSLTVLKHLVDSTFKTGYSTATVAFTPSSLLEACSSLGTGVPIMPGATVPDRIVYTGEPEQDSWRNLFADNSYPYHSDAAYHPTPPRLLILYCEETEPGAAKTLLIDPLKTISANHEQTLRTEPWRVVQGGNRFSTRIIGGTGSSRLLRWDPIAMRPFIFSRSKGRDILNTMIALSPAIEVNWTSRMILIVDNWRMLHARPPCGDDARRVLWRVLVHCRHS